MGDADTEGIVDRFGHAVLHAQVVVRSQTLETPDAGLLIPRTDADGIQVVDSVRYSQPMHERLKPDATRDDQTQRPVTGRLHRSAQPAEKLIDPTRAFRTAQHSLEEDR